MWRVSNANYRGEENIYFIFLHLEQGALASFSTRTRFLTIWHYSGGFFLHFCFYGKLWYDGHFQSWTFNISLSAREKINKWLWFKLCGNKKFCAAAPLTTLSFSEGSSKTHLSLESMRSSGFASLHWWKWKMHVIHQVKLLAAGTYPHTIINRPCSLESMDVTLT